MYQYPYQPYTTPINYTAQSMLPQQQVIRVNGENGARAYQMPANSSALLLDESAPLVWLAQTDGAGYKTVTPYKIEPYKQEDQPDLKTLENRISKLEEAINNVKSKSNTSSNQREYTK